MLLKTAHTNSLTTSNVNPASFKLTKKCLIKEDGKKLTF